MPWGQPAPRYMPSNQFWLDVGGRNEGHVFDHHISGSGSQFTIDLVVERFRDGELIASAPNQKVQLVTHIQPDIDGISACWVLCAFLDGRLSSIPSWLVHLADRIRDHDQGYEAEIEVEYDWIVWFSLELMLFVDDDNARIQRGFQILKEISKALERKDDLTEMPFVPSKAAESAMQLAKREFERDIKVGSREEVGGINGAFLAFIVS